VNNAAIGTLGTVVDTDDGLWDRIIAVKLKGPFLTSRTVIPIMRRQGGGSIVNSAPAPAGASPTWRLTARARVGFMP
jgi:NAD(P)-dependent dehydrogenase (short-subunit alcohol dehydrogenase family)